MKKFVKSVWLKKIAILPLLSPLTLTALSCGQSHPLVWNYQQFIDPDLESELSKKYGYANFGDLDELEAALQEKRVLVGMSSDYQIKQFARKNMVQKIDFKRLWGWEYESKQDLRQKLEEIYTPLVFRAFDQVYSPLGDLTGDGQEDYLWEYSVPYFVQEKVVVFDSRQGNWSEQEREMLDDPEQQATLFPNRSYRGILKTLADRGYQKIVVNDYVRDNLMIGSEVSPGGFNSLPTFETYESHIQGFKDTIERSDGFGQKLNSNNVKFDTDGTQVLMDLIDPRKDWDVALLYNGDALDAYWADDNFPLMEDDNFVRIVKPENPIFLIDGLILPTYLTGEYLEQAYEVARGYFFGNGELSVLEDVDLEEIPREYPILLNFDYVNYSLPFQVYQDYILEEGYFEDEDGEEDVVARDIYELDYDPDYDLARHFTQPIADTLFTMVQQMYELSKI
ncbi:hypothetical protein [Mycoplasma sp. ATU-Cv-703]|uniref:hypothetical protein n=1 Tax=Mycoplasma sp. ATU-Cv-703 TaxID=2498595 RepID=UPI000FDE081F